MLFNSYEFILAFLPITLAGFVALGAVSRAWAIRWLILASLVFYAWWRPVNVLIIAPSILVNFALARLLLSCMRRNKAVQARALLAFGIIFNIAFLGCFKYANFAVTAANDLWGTQLVLEQIILPLGISFITFQKIAFLVDVHAGRIESVALQDYCLFVLFFPQLIAGPIVHYREMMPQFRRAACKLDSENVSVGITLFAFGLFKKVCLADGMASLVNPIYEQAAVGNAVSLIPAAIAALGFTFQIYFDFSGYTDMALGAARLFGVRLPPNFDSPLKASSIIEFWQRWHMTLTRFLTAYVYNPLALALTRRRLRRGLGGASGRGATSGALVELVIFPTLLTMFISGVWHGAGYTFILWGVLHGGFLSINHGWRFAAARLWRDPPRYPAVMKPLGSVMTFACVAASMVVFRAPTVEVAGILLRGLVGLNGVGLPSAIYDRLDRFEPMLRDAGILRGLGVGVDLVPAGLWILLLASIALACPNTLEILRRHGPALGWTARKGKDGAVSQVIEWEASLPWAAIVSVACAIGMARLGGNSEFLYWQF